MCLMVLYRLRSHYITGFKLDLEGMHPVITQLCVSVNYLHVIRKNVFMIPRKGGVFVLSFLTSEE